MTLVWGLPTQKLLNSSPYHSHQKAFKFISSRTLRAMGFGINCVKQIDMGDHTLHAPLISAPLLFHYWCPTQFLNAPVILSLLMAAWVDARLVWMHCVHSRARVNRIVFIRSCISPTWLRRLVLSVSGTPSTPSILAFNSIALLSAHACVVLPLAEVLISVSDWLWLCASYSELHQ